MMTTTINKAELMMAARAIEFSAIHNANLAASLAPATAESDAAAHTFEYLLKAANEMEPIYRKFRHAYDAAVAGNHDQWTLFATDDGDPGGNSEVIELIDALRDISGADQSPALSALLTWADERRSA